MKKFLILLSLVFLINISYIFGQAPCEDSNCNPGLSSMGFSAVCEPEGDLVYLTITWYMQASPAGLPCTAPAGSWQIKISLPQNSVYGVTGASAVDGPGFSWTYDAANFVLTGTSNEDMTIDYSGTYPVNPGGDIVVTIESQNQNSCQATLSNANIQILPFGIPGACQQAFKNVAGDDGLESTYAVDSPLPLDLISFDGKMIECGEIELNWTAESEVNSDYIEVLRSTDGKNWVSAGKVGSQNLRSSTAIYSFTDTEGLDNYVRHYYYRLKQVDLNGNSTLHRIIGVKYDCIPANPEMKIFPNPASEKVKINITNISENRDIKAVIMNSNGHVVDDLMINSIHGAEVELKRFPSGVYKVQTLDLDEPVYQRFIHIK